MEQPCRAERRAFEPFCAGMLPVREAGELRRVSFERDGPFDHDLHRRVQTRRDKDKQD